MSKVVDLQAARERRTKQMAEAEEFIEVIKLPPEYEQRLNEENEKVLKLVTTINKVMDEYGEANIVDGKPKDSILVPVEALMRQAAGILSGLDHNIPAHMIEDSYNYRTELSDILADVVHDFSREQGMSGKMVFQHDMYMALIGAVCTLIFEHRIFQIQQSMSKGEPRNETRHTEDVQKGE